MPKKGRKRGPSELAYCLNNQARQAVGSHFGFTVVFDWLQCHSTLPGRVEAENTSTEPLITELAWLPYIAVIVLFATLLTVKLAT